MLLMTLTFGSCGNNDIKESVDNIVLDTVSSSDIQSEEKNDKETEEKNDEFTDTVSENEISKDIVLSQETTDEDEDLNAVKENKSESPKESPKKTEDNDAKNTPLDNNENIEEKSQQTADSVQSNVSPEPVKEQPVVEETPTTPAVVGKCHLSSQGEQYCNNPQITITPIDHSNHDISRTERVDYAEDRYDIVDYGVRHDVHHTCANCGASYDIPGAEFVVRITHWRYNEKDYDYEAYRAASGAASDEFIAANEFDPKYYTIDESGSFVYNDSYFSDMDAYCDSKVNLEDYVIQQEGWTSSVEYKNW